MKTKLVRPVLVESKAESHLQIKEGKLYYSDKLFCANNTDMPEIGFINPNRNQQLILISFEDEKIEVGDRVIYDFFDGHKVDVIVDNTIDTYPERWLGFKRVIACQSQLSLEYIQQFIEEYNKGEVKDISIEMEECTDGNGMYRNSKMFQPKLNNGFVTIVEKLQMPKISADDLPLTNGGYNEEDMLQAFTAGEQYCLMQETSTPKNALPFDKWIRNYKKES